MSSKKRYDYEIITGDRRNGKILYVPKLKCLYVKKSSTKSGSDWICYQTIIKKRQGSSDGILSCTSRVRIDINGICTVKRIPHTAHARHEIIYKDMKSKNRFIDDVVEISMVLEDFPVDVSNKDIFTRNMAK